MAGCSVLPPLCRSVLLWLAWPGGAARNADIATQTAHHAPMRSLTRCTPSAPVDASKETLPLPPSCCTLCSRLPTANPRCRPLLQVAAAIAAKEALQAAKDVRTLIAVDDYNALYWQTGEAATLACVHGGWAVFRFCFAGRWDMPRGSVHACWAVFMPAGSARACWAVGCDTRRCSCWPGKWDVARGSWLCGRVEPCLAARRSAPSWCGMQRPLRPTNRHLLSLLCALAPCTQRLLTHSLLFRLLQGCTQLPL